MKQFRKTCGLLAWLVAELCIAKPQCKLYNSLCGMAINYSCTVIFNSFGCLTSWSRNVIPEYCRYYSINASGGNVLEMVSC